VTQTAGTAIRFAATLETIDASTIVRLPESASKGLPSRGQVAVRGDVNGREFRTVLEPDGMPGDGATFRVEVVTDWPEPDVPSDLAAALGGASSDIREMWDDITPMARWEWVRWVNATANPATRQRRVEVTISKMENGKRRPCCFDLASCTDPTLAKNGKLRDPVV
jgi:hypothetical protein